MSAPARDIAPALEVDILDPDLYAAGIPHDRFELLRREAPVYRHGEPDGPGFWAITKHQDLIEVCRDTATFSSEAAGTQIPELPRTDLRASPDHLANMDPPRHSRYRALVSQAFNAHGLRGMDDFVRPLVAELLAPVIEAGGGDLMADLAGRLPGTVILRMVGVPGEDQLQLDRWIARLLTPDDPEFASAPEQRAAINQQFMEYAHALAAERRRAPRQDLVSRLMEAEVDGSRLSYAEFGMFLMLLLAAGSHTTRLAIGNGVLALLEHPEERRRLRDDPSLLHGAIEETLRWSPPMLHLRRTTMRDTSIRGRRIAAGDKVVVWHVSANRDEEVFARPHAFDIGRRPNEHVSFGTGPHFCLGNTLARLQIEIAVGECLARCPGLELDGPVERIRSNWLNGPKRLPVRVRAG